jgi:hypothetical protein
MKLLLIKSMLLPNIHLYNFNLYFSLVQGRAALQACKGE